MNLNRSEWLVGGADGAYRKEVEGKKISMVPLDLDVLGRRRSETVLVLTIKYAN